jgi:threonyl-tRNA synthetase
MGRILSNLSRLWVMRMAKNFETMNCPHHCEIYNQTKSWELPIQIEFGAVYGYEQSGELHGLTRVRSFTQDDAHIFCRPDQE